jgi:hypothetical protein
MSTAIKLLHDRDALLAAVQDAIESLRKGDDPELRALVARLRKTLRGLEYPPE